MDNRKIAKELVGLAKELTSASNAFIVNLKFFDNSDAKEFADKYDLKANSRDVYGKIAIRDFGKMVRDLDDYGVKFTVKGSS